MNNTGSGPAELTVAEQAGIRLVDGQPGWQLMRGVNDAGLAGEAGAVLQKLRNYRIRGAVVCAPGSVRFSSRFGEMAAEESRGGDFGVFESGQAVREWLTRGVCRLGGNRSLTP